jgi:choline-sulfatase
MYAAPETRASDSYAAFIAERHPAFNYIEDFRGERTQMYYIPQQSPVPAELAMESWASDRAIEFIQAGDDRPFFAFISFVGPHPPIAPPIPFNRMYNPDLMPGPTRGDIRIDHMDEQIPWMNYAVWADDVNDSLACALKARYYGQVTYIDHCIGRILDAVEKRPGADNTLICFFSDHGDHLGDHHAWQKESFFDVSCRVPFLISWPKRLPQDVRRDELVCLTDLFGIATSAAGKPDLRQGVDVLGIIKGRAKPREHLIGYYGTPGTRRFKIMVREKDWKYIFFANGGGEQLFNLSEDPWELHQLITDRPDVAGALRSVAVAALKRPNVDRAREDGKLRAFSFEARPRTRILQFDHSRGITGFPEHPKDLLG